MASDLPRMYGDLAEWWPLLSPPGDYEGEAAFFGDLIAEYTGGAAREVLELGSGGGHNAFHLKARFAMALADISPGMLAVSRALNPDCEHIEGDMRGLRLGRRFDAVFVHDAIEYMCTEEDLRAAMATAFAHCTPGGVAIFAPDHTAESFMEQTVHGGSDDGARGARYMEWTHDPNPDDTTYTMDFAYLLRHADGSCEVAHDRHICGLFSLEKWLELLEETGFEPDHLQDAWGRDIFVGLVPNQ